MTTQEKVQWKDLSDDEEDVEELQRQRQIREQQHAADTHKVSDERRETIAQGETNQAAGKYSNSEKRPYASGPRDTKRPYNSKGVPPPPKRKHVIEFLETKKAGIKASKNVYDMESSSDEEAETVEGQDPTLPEEAAVEKKKVVAKKVESEESADEQEVVATSEAEKTEEKKQVVAPVSKKQQKQQKLNELEAALKEIGFEAATEQPTVQEGDKKKKVKKEKKVEEVKPTETVTTTEVVAEVITSVSPIDAAAAAKEALLKRAAQQSSQPNKSKASIEVSKAKQEILNRQQKVKRALGKKKEDL